jgi:hypothetical protein
MALYRTGEVIDLNYGDGGVSADVSFRIYLP